MAVTTATLTIYQGADFSQVLTTNPVIDLTGAVGVCQIREKASGQYPILASPTVTLSGTPTDGTVTLALTDTETANMPVYGDTTASYSAYVFDVFVTISGTKSKIFSGNANVYPAVTR